LTHNRIELSCGLPISKYTWVFFPFENIMHMKNLYSLHIKYLHSPRVETCYMNCALDCWMVFDSCFSVELFYEYFVVSEIRLEFLCTTNTCIRTRIGSVELILQKLGSMLFAYCLRLSPLLVNTCGFCFHFENIMHMKNLYSLHIIYLHSFRLLDGIWFMFFCWIILWIFCCFWNKAGIPGAQLTLALEPESAAYCYDF
jgi:hypothetical protein